MNKTASNCVTKDWIEIDDKIKIKTTMLRSCLYDARD